MCDFSSDVVNVHCAAPLMRMLAVTASPHHFLLVEHFVACGFQPQEPGRRDLQNLEKIRMMITDLCFNSFQIPLMQATLEPAPE